MTAPKHSPAPWAYEYSPYQGRNGEIPAFEIVDADCNKVFDTNEDTPAELQEANARLATSAPRLLASLATCAGLLADYDESDGPEGQAYREAVAAFSEATGGGCMARKLPPDPDGMNDKRAGWAGAALATFMKVTGTDEEDAVSDLLADLIHWCDRNNYDFAAALDRGRGHYQAETLGESA